MSGISKAEVAERAGVHRDFVAGLVESGALVPDGTGTFSEGDVRRARLYEGLERAGISVDALIEALGRNELSFDFLDHPVYDRFSGLSSRSFRAVSSSEGIPLELLFVIREAAGLAQPEADDQMREDELEVVPLIRMQLAKGFDPAIVERWLRVCGDALRRITETEADWWRTQITKPSLASGMSMTEMLRVGSELGDAFTSLTEQALFAMYHANQERTWNENLVEEVEDALDRVGLRSKIVTTPAICFLDITGYTRLTEERGDQAAADLAAQLTPLVQRPAEHHDGKVVKWLGDGMMFHFRDPAGAVVAALEMIDALSAAEFPPAHIGLHAGPVVFQGGDYFGRAVNVAARIAERAGPGQILVSKEIVDRTDPGDVDLEPLGSFDLKGVSEPMALYSVTRL